MCDMCILVNAGMLVKETNEIVDGRRLMILKTIGVFNNSDPEQQHDIFLKTMMKRLILLMEWSDDTKREIETAIAVKQTEQDQADAETNQCGAEELRKLRETLGL